MGGQLHIHYNPGVSNVVPASIYLDTLCFYFESVTVKYIWSIILRMECSTDVLTAAFDKIVALGATQAHLKGKFLYCWPYKWEDQVNWELIQTLTKAVTAWIIGVIPGVSNACISESVESSVIWSVLSCPSHWRHNTGNNLEAYNKLLLYCKFIHFFFIMDDETEAHIGSNEYSTFVGCVGRIVYKIIRYQVPRTELKTDELFHYINQTSEFAGNILALIVDVAEDLKTNFGATQDSVEYLAGVSDKCFSLQAWLGRNDLSHLLNPYTQYHVRNMTGGILGGVEFVFALEEIYVPRTVRDNYFWNRCYEISGFLPLRANDVIGVEREWKAFKECGKSVDNTIYHYMETTNCSFEEAVTRCIRKHNFALKEFHDILKYSQKGLEFLHELNEEERMIFAKSTSTMGECMAYQIQGQMLMSRYNSGLELTFEKSATMQDALRN
ncbi:unnamed protein product [Allacma fusca]|uniref:Uncharacterized protein n=1 Tax=Allacma fusca TaxID=39272 RepID=A0A8J2KB18_9HEXA|nr:unnamed protein product [Allacma fusca]